MYGDKVSFDELNTLTSQKLDLKKFFSEMELEKDEKIRRQKTATGFYKALMDFFYAVLMDLQNGVFRFEVEISRYIDDLTDLYISQANDPTDREVILHARQQAEYIMNTTLNGIMGAQGNDNYLNGINNGLMIKRADMPQKVLKLFALDRALTIALNETNWIYNYDNHKHLVSIGQLTHTWVTMRDEKVRPTHWEADGQTKPIHEPFDVGGFKLLYPGDSSLGAPLTETMLCRCVEL